MSSDLVLLHSTLLPISEELIPPLPSPSFCDDMFGDSGENICENPSDKECKKFCKWLDSSSKSFSNRDYEMGMCDDPSDDDDGSDKDFCNDVSVIRSPPPLFAQFL